jgi:sugar lactone lactonase YvrE
MKRAACISRVWRPCLLALAVTSATLTGCSGSAPTGVVTGTVYFSGHVTRAVLAPHAKVVAWSGERQIAESPLKRGSAWVSFAPGSGASAVGTYRQTLAPGRYVLEVGASPPAGEVNENVVVIRAGATVKKDLQVVFHSSPVASVTDTPLHPYGLAVSPSGVLYVADLGRDEVLQYKASGTFIVVAGNGQKGFSGDGGPATEAELRLTAFSGLAVGEDGTLYIADSGNDRVRAVAPDGLITTVLGNGKGGGPPTSSAALEASVGSIEGLTIGPEGDLYAAAQKGIVHLTKQGTILWDAGSVTPQLLPPCGAFCNPAGESDFAGCDSLAFDAPGDLFCSGGAGAFAVYEVAAEPPGAAGQSLSYVGRFRGDGAPPALSEAPDGSVVMSYRGGVVRLTAHGTTTPITTLDGVLGTGGGHENMFIGGDGLTVGSDGSIYVDTDTGNTFTTVSAIVRVSTTGTSPTILWES